MLDIDDHEEERMTRIYSVAVYLKGRTPREHRFASPAKAKEFLDIQEALGRRCKPFVRYYPTVGRN